MRGPAFIYLMNTYLGSAPCKIPLCRNHTNFKSESVINRLQNFSNKIIFDFNSDTKPVFSNFHISPYENA